MKSICMLVLLVICYAGNTQNIATDKRMKGLDTFVNRVLKEWHAPGVTIAVVEKNKIIFAGGFGYADYEKKIPVTANTLFAIGSCTKAFTASMLGMLEKDGKINFDSPVRKYLPELKFYTEYLDNHVTLRDMMCHRTGLPRHDYSWYGSTATRGELLERIQWLEPSAELREKYQYNNFMFLAQGMLLEKLTGKSWEQNLKERILQPLSMVHTNMSVLDMEKASDRSLAYDVKKDSIIQVIPYRNIDNIAPAGAINSCASDMANWLITWINDGKFNGTEIIPPGFRNQAITSQVATGGGLPGNENPDLHMSGYGYAWGMSSYRAHYRVEHSGGIDGFSTSTSFFPSDSIGIFVVSNQGGATSSIRNFIADRMLGLSYRNWSKMQLDPIIKAKASMQKKTNSDSMQQKPNTKPSHALTDYTGVFENKGYGEMKTFIERDTLWIDYNEGGKRTKSYLQHYHYDIFRARSTEETGENFDAQKIKFNTGIKGDVESIELKMEPSVKDIIFTRKAPEVKLTKADLEKYTGDYNLSGLTVKVYTRGENTLMVLVPGQPDYELVPAGNDTFNFKILKGYSVHFDVNEKKESTAISFIQPNGTFKAEKKK